MENYKQVVRNRDKFCQICGTAGSKDNPLTVHHTSGNQQESKKEKKEQALAQASREQVLNML